MLVTCRKNVKTGCPRDRPQVVSTDVQKIGRFLRSDLRLLMRTHPLHPFLRSRSCWRGSPLTFALIGSLGYPAFAPCDTSPVRGLLQQVRGVNIGDRPCSEQLQRLPEL